MIIGGLSIFSYLCGATGRSNTQGKKVVHLHKKILTIFLTAGGQFCLISISTSGYCEYRQDLFIAVPLSRGSYGIDKVPAFFM